MNRSLPNSYRSGPDERGHFGIFGGRFVAETLMPLILEVEQAYNAAKRDPKFAEEMAYYRQHYIGRPSPLYFAERLTAELVRQQRRENLHDVVEGDTAPAHMDLRADGIDRVRHVGSDLGIAVQALGRQQRQAERALRLSDVYVSRELKPEPSVSHGVLLRVGTESVEPPVGGAPSPGGEGVGRALRARHLDNG